MPHHELDNEAANKRLQHAAKAAEKLAKCLDGIRGLLDSVEIEKNQPYAELTSLITNYHLLGKSMEIDDVPHTPFQVAYDPRGDGSYHAILCRGVDVSDHVSSSVESAACEVVLDAILSSKRGTSVTAFERAGDR